MFPLLGPAHADVRGLRVKEADDLEGGAQALDQDGSGFAACFCHEAQCMISVWSLLCRRRGQEGLLSVSVSVKGKGHTGLGCLRGSSAGPAGSSEGRVAR